MKDSNGSRILRKTKITQMNEIANSYQSAQALRAALKDHAKNRRLLDGYLESWLRDRFLCRVFYLGANSPWVLKGGTGMLARVPDARATTDVDIFQTGVSIEKALEDLKKVCKIDLIDFCRFQFVKSEDFEPTDAQPYLVGCRVLFDAYFGVSDPVRIKVDLTVVSSSSYQADLIEPLNRIPLKGIASTPYRIYQVSDQIADKVFGVISQYRGKDSSRDKDLIDLVIIAVSQSFNRSDLRDSLARQNASRGSTLGSAFIPPARFQRVYEREIKEMSVPVELHEYGRAIELLNSVLDLENHFPMDFYWNPEKLAWGEIAPDAS